MTRLNLPPDVAREKMIQAQQANQIYSMAFQIFVNTFGHMELLESDVKEVTKIAKCSIAAARFFNLAVQEDANASK